MLARAKQSVIRFESWSLDHPMASSTLSLALFAVGQFIVWQWGFSYSLPGRSAPLFFGAGAGVAIAGVPNRWRAVAIKAAYGVAVLLLAVFAMAAADFRTDFANHAAEQAYLLANPHLMVVASVGIGAGYYTGVTIAVAFAFAAIGGAARLIEGVAT